MPEFMLDQVKNTVGVLIEGQGSVNDYCGENFDFKLENTNKQLKSGLSWAPTYSMWLSACRCFNFMRSITMKLKNYLQLDR